MSKGTKIFIVCTFMILMVWFFLTHDPWEDWDLRWWESLIGTICLSGFWIWIIFLIEKNDENPDAS
jgi:hypothetical protein